jgi:hypothetical protein
MGFPILDGTGDGFEAKVDKDFRLHTQAVSRTELTQSILKGDGYNLSTGVVTLTSTTESALGYVKNEGDEPLVFSEILVIINPSSGGTGNGIIRIKRNPTAGTIITNADTNVTAANRNFASSKTIDGIIYKGGEGLTITDGSDFAISTRDAAFSGVLAFDAAPIVLEKGSTLAVTFQPASGNVSQSVVLAGTGFVETGEIN